MKKKLIVLVMSILAICMIGSWLVLGISNYKLVSKLSLRNEENNSGYDKTEGVDVSQYIKELEKSKLLEDGTVNFKNSIEVFNKIDGSYYAPSFNDSDEAINRINEGLDSFTKLTEKSKEKLTEEEIRKIGNTGWETQVLGFNNWQLSIKLGLRNQNYQIKKLEFELAIKKYEDGEITKEELDQKMKDFVTTKKEIEKFAQSTSFAD